MDVTKLIDYAITQGPWAVTFMCLLVYVMRENKERERKLHELLSKFTEKYDVIIEEIRELKDKFQGKSDDK